MNIRGPEITLDMLEAIHNLQLIKVFVDNGIDKNDFSSLNWASYPITPMFEFYAQGILSTFKNINEISYASVFYYHGEADIKNKLSNYHKHRSCRIDEIQKILHFFEKDYHIWIEATTLWDKEFIVKLKNFESFSILVIGKLLILRCNEVCDDNEELLALAKAFCNEFKIKGE